MDLNTKELADEAMALRERTGGFLLGFHLLCSVVANCH